MAKQIKVLKCPSCGNTKPLSQANDQYRCDKCDTNFFLESQDINVNVKHSFDKAPISFKGENITIMFVVLCLSLVIFSVFYFSASGIGVEKSSDSEYISKGNSLYPVNDKEEIKVTELKVFPYNNKPVALYIESRNLPVGQRDQDGIYGVFYDFLNAKVLKEIKLSSNYADTLTHRFFPSQDKDYYIIDNKSVYCMDPDNLEIKDVTKQITDAKPALQAGFSKIGFVEQGNGDGFIIDTKLGKTFYYFPTQNSLYTYEAFKHLSTSGLKGIAPDATTRSKYLFVNKETHSSLNVGQLMKVDYKYNNGGPEQEITHLDSRNLQPGYYKAYRVEKLEPIGQEFVCFFSKVLYADQQGAVIVYKPIFDVQANQIMELIDINGKQIWKVTNNWNTKLKNISKVGSTYYVQKDHNVILELNKDGFIQEYYLQR